MKKVLIILLALLVVTGVVFANDSYIPTNPLAADDATLTLTSMVQGQFEHGFAETASQETLGTNAYTVLMTETEETAKNIGFYVLRTNAGVGFNVDFKVSPMTNAITGDGAAAATAYVPYTLTITHENIDAAVAGTRVFNHATGGGAWGSGGNNNTLEIGLTNSEGKVSWSVTPIAPTELVNVIKHGTLGSGELALGLKVDFGSNNDNANAPEGEYSGTIVASITATT